MAITNTEHCGFTSQSREVSPTVLQADHTTVLSTSSAENMRPTACLAMLCLLVACAVRKRRIRCWRPKCARCTRERPQALLNLMRSVRR